MALIDVLLEPLTLAIIAIGVIGFAAIIYVIRGGGGGLSLGGGGGSGKSKKYVLLLRNKDRRFKHIKIIDEHDEALEAPKEKNGVTRFFIKKGPGWTDEDRPQTMFLGFNAYAYTLIINKVPEKVLKLAEAVRIVLGKEVYDVITPDLRDKLEKAEFGINVEPDDPTTTGATLTGNETRHTVSDEKMIDYYAEKNAKAMQGNKIQWTTLFMGLTTGIVIGIAIVSFKVIKLA
jgi:hypothetical protein